MVRFIALMFLVCGLAQAATTPIAIAVTASPINASVIASRTSGIAPLAVLFETVGTTSSGATSYPFHEIQYTWNFGDDDTALWSYGAHAGDGTALEKKNRAIGPVAAHVYETAGTYTATVTMFDGTNTAVLTRTITVADADASYPTTSTICLSSAGVFVGCPAGASQVTDATADFDAALATYLDIDKRLLFNRGETWGTSAVAIVNKSGITIGAYGTGAKPAVVRSAGTVILQIGTSGDVYSDARIMDLDLSGTANCVSGSGTFDFLTLLRIDCHDSNYGISLGYTAPSLVRIWNGFTVADSTIKTITGGAGGNGMFIAMTRGAVLGNWVNDTTGAEHNARSMYSDRVVFAHNTLENPAPSKGVLILRAPPWECDSAACGPLPHHTYSQYIGVSGNKFIGGVDSDVAISLSIDGGHDARTRNIIFDGNWWTGQVGTLTALSINSDLVTVRNNLCDLSDSVSDGQNCFSITANGNAQPDPGVNGPNWILNNTARSSAAKTTFRIVNLAASAHNTVAKNNLGYAPNITNAYGVVDAGVGTTVANNSSDAQVKTTDPLFASVSPFTPANAKPTAGSYAIGGGAAVPVRSDFFLSPPPSPRDMGAVVH